LGQLGKLFENISHVNSWDESSKLLWLKVQPDDKAHVAQNRLPEESKGNYNLTKAALRKCTESDNHKHLYAAQLQICLKRQDLG